LGMSPARLVGEKKKRLESSKRRQIMDLKGGKENQRSCHSFDQPPPQRREKTKKRIRQKEGGRGEWEFEFEKHIWPSPV